MAIEAVIFDWGGTLSIYADTGFLVDGPAPEEGDLAVYVGDNFADPGINPSHVYSAAAASSGADLLLSYYDKFFRGKFGPTLWAARLASMSGVATGSKAGAAQRRCGGGDAKWALRPATRRCARMVHASCHRAP